MNPQLARLVAPDTKFEKVAGDFQFTEGPVWIARENCLLFSDIPASRIMKWSGGQKGRGITIFREPSNNSNGLTLDRQGRLVTCEHGSRRVSHTEKDGTVVTLADRHNGKRLNSPNDVCVRSDGSIYFTDPPYGVKPPDVRELDFQGVYRITPDGKLSLAVKDFDMPNGLAFSPDEKTLYIDDSKRRHMRAFDVAADGSLSNSRIFADMEDPAGVGSPDGMKLDVEGNIYCTGPSAIWVFNPKGELLGKLHPPEKPSNLAWGDADRKTLYVTARTSLYRIRVLVPGIRSD